MRRSFLAGALICGVMASIAGATDVAAADPPPPPPPRFLKVGVIPAAFENTAVQEVLTSHNLPASDHDAVVSWGRNDVAAQEFLDLQNVVKQQHIAVAQDAIQEYLRWSGLSSIDDTNAPFNFGPSTMTYLGTPGV